MREERFPRGAPADVERRECAPLVSGAELRRTVPAQGGARIVPLRVVVVRLAEERQQPIERACAAHVLRRRRAERVLNVSARGVFVEEARDAARQEPAGFGVRLLAEQGREVMACRGPGVVQCIR